MTVKKLFLPTDAAHIKEIEPGDSVRLYGTLYTARDQAHKRMAEAIERGEPLPIDLSTAAIYYCGPTPAPEGAPIGACGPTTSGRMDAYTPLLISRGLRVMIGKGVRSPAVNSAIKQTGAIYFTAIGGAAALYMSRVTDCKLVAYPDLGCEAIYRLEVADFPVVAALGRFSGALHNETSNR